MGVFDQSRGWFPKLKKTSTIHFFEFKSRSYPKTFISTDSSKYIFVRLLYFHCICDEVKLHCVLQYFYIQIEYIVLYK